jgi:hypothetical protein
MSDIEYRTTKEQCEARIGDVVCPGCGGPVTAIETVDNSHHPTFWAGCESCCLFTTGCSLKVHQIARLLVEERTLVLYRHLDDHRNGTDEEQAYWLHSQTNGAAAVVRRTMELLEVKAIAEAAKEASS